MRVSSQVQPIATPIARGVAGAGVGPSFASIVNNGVLAPYVTFTRASTATYFDSAGVMQTAAVNVPRVDYDPATLELRGLLVEEQRTNFVTNSDGITGSTGTTVTANAAMSPTGATNASRIAKTDATTPRFGFNSTAMTVAANTTYTVSRFVKYDGHTTQVSLEYNNVSNWGGTGWVAVFNVAASGVTLTSQQECTTTITSFGDGWYRITATFTTGGTITTPSNPTYLSRITGASGVSVLVYGSQLEAGAFATSYIPTTGTAQTRAADTAVAATLSDFGYSADEGTLLAEFAPNVVAGTTNFGAATLFDAAGAASWAYVGTLAASGDSTMAVRRASADSLSTSATGSSAPNGQMRKAAVAYSISTSCIGASKGILSGVGVAMDGPMSGVTQLRIGRFAANPGYLNGHIRRLRYYPRRLPNATLQALTA